MTLRRRHMCERRRRRSPTKHEKLLLHGCQLGGWDLKLGNGDEAMSKDNYALAIEKHYTKCWGAPIDAGRLSKGPTHELPNAFRVLVFELPDTTTVYATQCMSRPADSQRLELHLRARPNKEYKDSLVELLTIVAHYHRTGSSLGLAHSVNFGRPWVAGSSCSHGVISLPYEDGPSLEYLDEPEVRFLWLIPVTRAEVDYKKLHGMDSLEERFENAGFDYLDPERASVV